MPSRPLTPRKLHILRYIIEEYRQTAEPVGSRTISKNPELGVSAATIRNEMSDLAEMGLLIQPHTSAGRVPSPEAYQLYVAQVAKSRGIGRQEQKVIEQKLSQHVDTIHELIEDCLGLLSSLTCYTSIALTEKSMEEPKIIHELKISRIGQDQAVAVIVFSDASVQSLKISLPSGIRDDTLQWVLEAVSQKMRGKRFDRLDELFAKELKKEIHGQAQLIEKIFCGIVQEIKPDVHFNLLLNGTANIFNYPEFNSLEKARSFFSVLDQKEQLAELIREEGIRKGGVNILIGNDSMAEGLGNCSIVTTQILKQGQEIGRIGVIGPRRMDYDKALSVMKYLTERLTDLIPDP